MEFRILGPLEVVAGDRALILRSAKQRALLAILLLHANEVVASDRLIDGLWGERPPRTAAHALQVFVSELRKAFRSAGEEGDRIVTRAPGYAIRVDPDDLDLERFQRLAEDGARALADDQPRSAASRLREALSLWRGPPLADFAYEPFAQAAIARLEELRLAAAEERIEADLALGRHRDLVAELEELTTRHPLRERLSGQLMLALYRSGRQGEALAVYQSARRLLVDELGIEPKPALQALEKAILLQDPALEPETAAPAAPTGERVTLLFTDIEGSTRLLEALGERYADVLSDHHRLLREAFRDHGGREVDAAGDGFFVVFDQARNALAAAVAGQHALAAHRWPDGAAPRVRMALHAGAPMRADGAYVGLDVHRAARICSAAHGKQILLSRPARDLVAGERPEGVALRALGEYRLRDLPTSDHLFQAVVDGLESEFPAPRIELPAAEPDGSTDARSILAAATDTDGLDSLVAFASPLARSDHPHDLVLARLVADAAALGRASRELNERRVALTEEGVGVRVAAFVAAEPAHDVVRLAADQDVDLVLVDSGWALTDGDELSSEAGALLAQAPSDVAICLLRDDRSPSDDRPIVVPFGGNEHDWAALELGAWLASAHGAALQLLGLAADPDSGRRDASRLLATASLAVQQLVGIPAQPLLVAATADAILEAAHAGSLLVAGLAGDWAKGGLGQLRLALAASGAPTVFVRRGVRPGGLAPREGLTRYTWSLASVAPSSAATADPV